jgi:glycosyltransferase involved in cell wall biosynthesis
MADPGSLAAATVARERGIPTVFTMAPDPHGPIAAAEQGGALDRRRFAAEDARAALWYRAVLVEHLARTSQELVLFPRQDLHRQIGELMGIDLAQRPRRHTIVSEGVDIRQADRAADAVAAARPVRVIDDLCAAVLELPADRRGLPMLVSVGRLAEVKGMARVVEAFVTDPGVADRANLVIVGGDLAEPSTTEAAELARITTVLDRHPRASDGVILLGHRPNGDVSQLLAVARAGWGTDISAGGAYVCGSRKEEFGLAIVEAMAAGLPVVVPRAGGPATYVDDGMSGVIVDTTDPAAIARGMRACLALARRPETALSTRRAVESRFTLARMAQGLTAVYRIAVAGQTRSLPVAAGLPA